VTSAVDSDIAIVLTTLAADADAAAFARTLVEERLAACVNVIGPVTSIYRWNGKVAQDAEQQLVVKTTTARLVALEARVKALHPYDVPELLVLTAAGGSAAYLTWLRDSTS
jgi:periplasmic divalent cation tolerance protein